MTVSLSLDWLEELLAWERSPAFRDLPLEYHTVKVEFMLARADIIPMLQLMTADPRCREALSNMAHWENDTARDPFPRADLTLVDQFINWYIYKSGLRHLNSLYSTVILTMAKSIVIGVLDPSNEAEMNRLIDERAEDFRKFVESEGR